MVLKRDLMLFLTPKLVQLSCDLGLARTTLRFVDIDGRKFWITLAR